MPDLDDFIGKDPVKPVDNLEQALRIVEDVLTEKTNEYGTCWNCDLLCWCAIPGGLHDLCHFEPDEDQTPE